MKSLIFIVFFVIQTLVGAAQNFVRELSKFREQYENQAKRLPATSAVQQYNRSLEVELDTIFESYKRKTGFDFNQADSLFIIVSTPDDMLFFSDVIVWSGSDTLFYRQGYEATLHGKPRRHVEYVDMNNRSDQVPGYKTVSETDSVMTLIQGRNLSVLNDLGRNQGILDGGRLHIYIARRSKYKYQIQVLHPDKFFIPVTYRKL